MARKAFSGQGLPSPEVRRQILERAGTILDEARDLMARLDRQETPFLAIGPELPVLTQRTTKRQDLVPLKNCVNNAIQTASGSDSPHTTLSA
jgi:hypothetical protein